MDLQETVLQTQPTKITKLSSETLRFPKYQG